MDNLFSDCNVSFITVDACLSSFCHLVIGVGQKSNFVFQKKVFFDKKHFLGTYGLTMTARSLKPACEAHKAWKADILNTHFRSIYFDV